MAWALGLTLAAAMMLPAGAEYGDVVLNRKSEAAGMRPVIFRTGSTASGFVARCATTNSASRCAPAPTRDHGRPDLRGQVLRHVHNGEIAWGLENCGLCHSGRAGLPSGIRGGHKTLGPGRW